jgi:hypothetical protein
MFSSKGFCSWGNYFLFEAIIEATNAINDDADIAAWLH